jgi:hypothetical protein
MICPVCRSIVTKAKNPKPENEMHIYSCEENEEDYLDGPVDMYECLRCDFTFYVVASKLKKALKDKPAMIDA